MLGRSAANAQPAATIVRINEMENRFIESAVQE